ncbi:MAG: KpsF/GutQ family sugar-phosphate isomerase [Bacteroidales bacterium]|nr:KpsF/GutQ family sugar-phosphate isomerase [Bacteroidales bacterium]
MDNFHQNIHELAVNTIRTESAAILKLADYIDQDFVRIIDLLYSSEGRVIITGIGKSAIIGQKIVATLNSTGTPSIFMHAADAIHGDLGIVQDDDSVICISKSGNTPEIKVLVPLILNRGNKLIAMVSNTDSYLAKNAHYVLKAIIEKEACPNNLAPTTSTTAQLVLGDAMAICLLDRRGFSKEDFAKVHPGGSLGKKLYLRVEDLFKMNDKPMVFEDTSLSDTIYEISSKRLGATAVVTKDETLIGFITDGDIRRMLQRGANLQSITAQRIMSSRPKSVHPDDMAISAFHIMEKYKITQLPVLDENGKYLGMVHLHDILKEGIV